MEDLTKFSQFVGSLYDCVPNPSGWRKTLQILCDHFDGVLATLAVLDAGQKHSRFGAYCGEPTLVEPLVTTYAAEMPFYNILPLMEVDVPLNMEGIYELAGPGSREKFYSGKMGEWTVPNRIADCFCLAVLKQDSRVGCFNLTTDSRRPTISEDELQTMALLAPHIRRAVTIGDLLEIEQQDAHIFRDIVNALGTAVFVVSAPMKLVYANPMAETVLRDRTVAQLIGNQLAFISPLADAAIRKAVAIGQRSEIALGTAGIGVPMSNNAYPAVAHVLPLANRAAGSEFSSNAVAAIFVAARGSIPLPAVEGIAALYGLTAAEKRVLAQIAFGRTRHEIAEATGVADGTIKAQLKTIYEKTGASSQRSLENLIRELTPPLRPEDSNPE